MYFRQEIVAESLKRLDQVHPFFGIGFLVCKQAKLPVGKMLAFGFGHAEEQFLREYYRPDLKSKYFFQPFRTSNAATRWLQPKYPHAGSQSTRTRGDIADAFLHEKKTDKWGWQQSYVDVLAKKVERDGAGFVPAFWLAVWLLRHLKWADDTTPKTILAHFSKQFLLTKSELDRLFDSAVPHMAGPLLTPERFDDATLLRQVDPAPDATPDEGGTLRTLSLRNVGPAAILEFDPILKGFFCVASPPDAPAIAKAMLGVLPPICKLGSAGRSAHTPVRLHQAHSRRNVLPSPLSPVIQHGMCGRNPKAGLLFQV